MELKNLRLLIGGFLFYLMFSYLTLTQHLEKPQFGQVRQPLS
jgi:hypothetical protein